MSNTSLLGSYGGLGNSGLQFRNRIINGDMRIAQRGTVTVNPAATGNAYTAADRWSVSDFFGATGQLVTTTDTDVPVGQGFTSSLRVNCATTLQLNYGSTRVRQRIEGFNIADLYKSNITLSFWAKTSVAGQYTLAIGNSTDRFILIPIIFNAANTWEKKVVTVSLADGTSAGTWITNNNTGLEISLYLAGSAFSGTADVWGSTASVLAGQAAWGTQNHDFRITGVQLEAGPVATPFEHRPVGLELSLCQRYTFSRGGDNATYIGTVMGYNSTLTLLMLTAPVSMRDRPNSITATGSYVANLNGIGFSVTFTELSPSTKNEFIMLSFSGTNIPVPGVGYLYISNAGKLIISAEL